MKEHILQEVSNLIPKAYLQYAMYVIQDRALPKVEDGLKPVQRRVLFSMHEQGITHRSKTQKSAKTVGDTMGKYHPHGDAGIYNAVVTMVRPFTSNHPLIDGQGNFGDLDTNPAAPRYTECRLSELATRMLGDIAVMDTQETYDGEHREPIILPAAYPNLLVNGCMGIAVGMASSILPHNLAEVIDATTYLIDNPDASIKKLCKYIKGPDFPTGGIISEDNNGTPREHIYEDGRGGFKVRAHMEIEQEGGRTAVVIRDLPYNVSRAKVLTELEKLKLAGKIDNVKHFADESDLKEGMRIVVEPVPGIKPDIIINKLFKYTSCESTLSLNLRALQGREPMQFSLRGALQAWIDFRFDTVTRRLQRELDDRSRRLMLVEGLLSIAPKIAEVVEKITKSDQPSEMLQADYGLNQQQAEYILSLQLRRLSKLEWNKLSEEQASLKERIAYLKKALGNPDEIRSIIKDELKEIKKQFGRPRQTEVVSAFSEINVEDIIADDHCIVVLTDDDELKRLKVDDLKKTKNRGGSGSRSISGNKPVKDVVYASSHDDLLIFTRSGRAYYFKTYAVPEGDKNSKGIPVHEMIDLENDDRVAAMLAVDSLDEQATLFMLTSTGTAKRVEASEFKKNRRSGVTAIKMLPEESLQYVGACSDEDDVMVFANDGRCLRFSAEKVRTMGRTARGVATISLDSGQKVIAGAIAGNDCDVITVTDLSYGKRVPIGEFPSKKGRTGKGVNTFDPNKHGSLVGVSIIPCTAQGDLIMSSQKGRIIRTPLKNVKRLKKRTSRGVILQKLNNDDNIVSAAVIVDES